MKKLLLIPIILGGVLLVAGGVVFAVALANSNNSANIVDKTYDLNDSFSNIDIKLSTADLTFKVASDGNKKVVLQEREKQYHSVNVNNDTLSIEYRDDRKWHEKIFSFDWKPMKVDIYLPSAEYGNLKIDSATGDIVVPKEFTFANFNCELSTGNVNLSSNITNELYIKSSTGDINYKDATCGSLNFKSSTGHNYLKNVVINGKAEFNASTGYVKLENTTFTDLDIKASTGDVTLTDSVGSGKLTIKTSTGDVKFNDADAAELDIKTDTGWVKGTLLTSKQFSCKSDTGKIRVPEWSTGGHCRIETDTGDINITIKE